VALQVCSSYIWASNQTKNTFPKSEKGIKPARTPRTDPDPSNCSIDRILSEKVCLGTDYLRADLPLARKSQTTKWINTDSILVNCESEIVTVRDVDDKTQTVSFDIFIHLQWRDDRIKVKPSSIQDEQRFGSWHILDSNQINKIWNPDLTIYNMSSFKRLSTLNPSNGFLKIYSKLDKILVDYVFDAQVTIYCKFDYSSYPMDEQHCELRMGSISYGRHLNFVLWKRIPRMGYNDSVLTPPLQVTDVKGFNIKIKKMTDNFAYCNPENREENKLCKARHLQHVVFDIQMKRYLPPIFMHYYAPCIYIVLVTHASFIIPPDCIPGRIALLVTQFLTLVNIFIDQQVTLSFKCQYQCKNFVSIFTLNTSLSVKMLFH
jgi:hypothetical protein